MKMNAWVSALLVVGGSLVASCDSHDETPPTPRAAPAVREIIGGVPVDLADLARSSAPVTLRGHADASGHVRLRVSNAPGEGYTLEVGVHGQAFPRVIAVQRMHVDASPAGGTTSHTCLQNGCVSV
ncbi:MAG: hypothetical protein IPK60_05315 [Sandaracinaceae bacterium]|nr:hypothetical protein [Sandaracinaceae bacterium]